MSCTLQVCQTWGDGAGRLVRESVRILRTGGAVKNEIAIDLASRRLGLSTRRTRTLLYAEPCAVARAEYERLKTRFAVLLDAEAERLEREAQALHARAAAALREANRA